MEEKVALYEKVLQLWEGLARDEGDRVALLANTCALLHHTFPFHWTGFYLVRGDWLVLGPFQGPLACSRIGFGKGVCGAAWAQAKTLVVPNVHLWSGHIACSPLSNSEIVVPVCLPGGNVVAVLDVDSTEFSAFDSCDVQHLETLCRRLGEIWWRLS
ncbi:MAG: GAF domain-containing protein [Flavobacteriales bacterium]|nr:GAF domain-containing protein [Flavobacteriales bacterium]MDW8410577.1 GAF domain-containing protein [Flavobacteriales bacterium]